VSDLLRPRAMGQDRARVDGALKVQGLATYAFEQQVEAPTYLYPLRATIARGRVVEIDTSEAEALDGVLVVMTYLNAPPLADPSDGELGILQSNGVAFRGQLIGAVVAETSEVARHASELVRVTYDVHEHDSELRADRDDLYEPSTVNPDQETTSDDGGVDAALAAAPVSVDATYRTPMEVNNPLEPHSCTAIWSDGPQLTLYDSTQGAHSVRTTLAPILGLDPAHVRVVSPYVGGGFGSKGMPHAHNVLVAMAAQLTGGRPVKLALTRQQMFDLVGYRTPTIQRVRLGADRDGRLLALSHEAVEQTARVKEFAEQTTVISRVMYDVEHRRSTHRLAALDVPVNSWMRAPGEAPGSFGLECAVDELADACGVDPVELRIRNEPSVDPATGRPGSGRLQVECLRQGAEEFGWSARQAHGQRREGDWLVGYGVAAATYPGFTMPGSEASVTYRGEGRYDVRIGAADIGTGTWTALPQIAADALDVDLDCVHLEIGDTDLPMATVEGGSSGLSSWGSTVVAAAQEFRKRHGSDPEVGDTVTASAPEELPDAKGYAVHSFGAHFVEARVDVDTGEVRVPRMLSVFSAGRIVNPRTARSQLIGGMTFGISMALHEEAVIDHLGHVATRDLVDYHVPVNADIGDLQARWLDIPDEHANPMGTKGIGEIGIVGSAAAVANAVHNATGVRVRDLPLTPDKLVR
jgi:xanthine dehydrogenase YagR molybdenum-binding subunit